MLKPNNISPIIKKTIKLEADRNLPVMERPSANKHKY